MTFRDLAAHDAELIAAFIDKRLPEDERQAFLERLDKDEALYEVFVETVRYRDQAEAEGGKVLVPSAWGRKWSVLAAVAALLAVAVATPVLLRNLSGESYAEALVADGRLAPYLEEGWYEQGWSEMRGEAATTRVQARTAFRLGVLSIDLEIAVRTGNTEPGRKLIQRIMTLLHELEFSEPLQASYVLLWEELEQGADTRQGVDLAVSNEELLEEFVSNSLTSYELGRWAEAGSSPLEAEI